MFVTCQSESMCLCVINVYVYMKFYVSRSKCHVVLGLGFHEYVYMNYMNDMIDC